MDTSHLWRAAIAGMGLLLALDVHAFGGRKPIPVDPVVDAVVAGDATGLVEGCGAQPIVGFTYCRVVEGDAAEQKLAFIGPPAKCAREDACVFVKVFTAGGQVAWGGMIKKGETRVEVPWKAVLGGERFEALHKGWWAWNVDVLWTDADGNERRSRAQGDLILRVFPKGYTPLDRVKDDPAFAWIWTDSGREYKMTTGLRAYTGKVP